MSRQARFLITALACLTALVVLFGVRQVHAGKPSPPISLKANFEQVWYDGSGVAHEAKIRNDVEGSLYVDTADTKRVKYGVEVKYYPPGSWDTRGRFRMKVDLAGVLGRYVRMFFDNPLNGPNCVSDKAGCGVGGFLGGIDPIETRFIEISTQISLVENAAGQLVRDVDQPIRMDLMKTGDSKIVGLGISFTPNDPDFDYVYDLGHFTDPESYVAGLTCQERNYPWGPAELYCVATGQVWEFRPCSKAYVNEPDNRWRLLFGEVLLDFWTYCRLQKWNMPFVLKVTK